MTRVRTLFSRRSASPALAFVLVASLPRPAAAQVQKAPAWELQDVYGKTVKLSDFKGKVVVLDFWATWCGPCRDEIPGLISLQKKYGSRGLVVIGVAMDLAGAAAVIPSIRELGINYPVVLSTAEMAARYGDVEAIPTTFIISRDGKIAAGHEGLTDTATIESEIKPLL